MREAGEHAAEWNGRDEAGRRVPPGVYLFRLRTAGLTEARRVVVLD
jgi:flagellar hook assembly protein FlgD